MSLPRFYVYEQSPLTWARYGPCLVMDRAYCHRVIRTFTASSRYEPPKEYADRFCAELNRKHAA